MGADPTTELATHPKYGEIFSRAHALYRGGTKVVPVRGILGIIRGFVNVASPEGMRREIYYFADRKGLGCCLLGAAMIGLEVPSKSVNVDMSTMQPVTSTCYPISWLLYRSAAEKMGLLCGFDGLPITEAYTSRGERVATSIGGEGCFAPLPEAHEFGVAARSALESEFGPIPWVGSGPDPDLSRSATAT